MPQRLQPGSDCGACKLTEAGLSYAEAAAALLFMAKAQYPQAEHRSNAEPHASERVRTQSCAILSRGARTMTALVLPDGPEGVIAPRNTSKAWPAPSFAV